MIKIKFSLNGTNENRYLKLYGLRCNPFPQIAKAEYMAGCRALNELGGEPIPPDRAEAYIREKLKGFTSEFVDWVVSKYKPGEMVWLEFAFPANQL